MEDSVVTNKKEKRRRYLIGLLISLIITALLTGLFLLIQFWSGRKITSEGLLMWINALTASGSIMILFYLLILLSDGGAFDILAYSIKLFWVNTFHRNERNGCVRLKIKLYRRIYFDKR